MRKALDGGDGSGGQESGRSPGRPPAGGRRDQPSAGAGGQNWLTSASICVSAAIALVRIGFTTAGVSASWLADFICWSSSSSSTVRPGITASNSPATAWLVCACTRPASAGAGGAGGGATFPGRVRREAGG